MRALVLGLEVGVDRQVDARPVVEMGHEEEGLLHERGGAVRLVGHLGRSLAFVLQTDEGVGVRFGDEVEIRADDGGTVRRSVVGRGGRERQEQHEEGG